MSNKFNIKRNARFLRVQAGLVNENRLSLAGYEEQSQGLTLSQALTNKSCRDFVFRWPGTKLVSVFVIRLRLISFTSDELRQTIRAL
jgi:hypothetical protein